MELITKLNTVSVPLMIIYYLNNLNRWTNGLLVMCVYNTVHEMQNVGIFECFSKWIQWMVFGRKRYVSARLFVIPAIAARLEC